MIRLRGRKDFTFIAYLASGISRLNAIDRKRNLLTCCMSFYVNRICEIIDKSEILTCRLCNRCIHGRLDIGNNHGMIVSLHHLKL